MEGRSQLIDHENQSVMTASTKSKEKVVLAETDSSGFSHLIMDIAIPPGFAEAQVHPGIACLQALFAAIRSRQSCLYIFKV
jgi:hypothetical protein